MKCFLSLLTIVLSANFAMSQQIISLDDGTTTAGVHEQYPVRTVTNDANGIIVTYSFEKATIIDDHIYTGCYMWRIAGYGVEDAPAKPAVPYRLDSFAIPDGCSVNVAVVDSAFVDIPFALSPARPSLTDSGNEQYSIDNVPEIAPYHGFYPNSVACLNGISWYRGKGVAEVMVTPVQYNYNEQIVRAYKRISFRVEFSQAIGGVGGITHKTQLMDTEDKFLQNITINETDQILNSKFGEIINQVVPRDYLILTTPKFAEQVRKLANWKKLLGFKVHTIINNHWTTDSIKSVVKKVYELNDNLYYLLIFGDMADVPSCTSQLVVDHVTDFYYSCLDGDEDHTPDLLYGRIPVKTKAEAAVVIDKVIDYEKNPVTDSTFYRTGLHCAYFQDTDSDSYADRRFAQTSEEVRNSLIDEGIDVIRVYAADEDVIPLYWNNEDFSYGEPIPNELRKPSFAWSGNATDINGAINDGAFYVLHRDHGNDNHWGNPYYDVNDINYLSNGRKLPVVFSINCHTGDFNSSDDSFCEAFLKKKSGGCVAIFGATEKSYTGFNDILTEGMFDAIWPSDKLRPMFPNVTGFGGSTPTPTYEIGQILNQGKARLTETYGSDTVRTLYTKELFHCFGDPSMKIYTSIPTPFSEVSIDRGNDYVNVQLIDSTIDATIVFHDLVTDELIIFKDLSANYQTEHPLNITVCIKAHNKVPFISEGMDPNTIYIQNETIVGTRTYEANAVKVGTNVAPLLPVGAVVIKDGNVAIKANTTLIDSGTVIEKGTSLKVLNK